MISGIFKLIDGSLAQQVKFENISNNLSNINTNGFKKSVISFDMALAQNNLSSIDLSPGPIVHTGNKLDVALEGTGFFKVMTSEGIKYTRDGAFTLDKDGLLTTRSGNPVLGENGPITLSGDNITIARDGQVGDQNGLLDKLSIVDFTDPQFLQKEGGSLYQHTGEKRNIVSAEQPGVQQSYLEKSNVNPSEEMIKMIEAFRNFESVQKAIQNMDEITSKMVNDPDLI